MNHKYFEENIEGSKMSRKSPSRDNLEINKDGMSSVHIAVVAAKWNSNITDNLVKGAQIVLKNSGIPEKNIDIYRVPGAFELPFACQKLTNVQKLPSYNGIIALGCVIRGETPHFDYICQETTRGLGEVVLRANIPVGYGLLTTDDLAQAEQRSHIEINSALGQSNKGQDAADAVLEMIHTFS